LDLPIATLLSGFIQTAVFPTSLLQFFVRKGLDMTVIQPGLFSLFERFPDRKETIKALFEKNESFQTLCDDYRQCAEALRYWNRSSDEDAPARMREYKALLRELEEEILQNVNEPA
jgi:hypothetical protein